MKSYLPIFLLIGGLVIFSLVGFAIFNLRSQEAPQTSGEEIKKSSIEPPYTTLIPNSAGNGLTLSITGIDSKVTSLEYELVYNTEKGVLQGVPGSIDVSGQTSITRQLTLGTCSGRVCRYDRGVKDITLTIRLRDGAGKLLAKFGSGVALLSKTKNLSSTDDKFTLTLDRAGVGFYVVMQTGGVAKDVPGEVVVGPYGVFTSGDERQNGQLSLVGKLFVWDSSKWQPLSDGKTKMLGVFVGVKE